LLKKRIVILAHDIGSGPSEECRYSCLQLEQTLLYQKPEPGRIPSAMALIQFSEKSMRRSSAAGRRIFVQEFRTGKSRKKLPPTIFLSSSQIKRRHIKRLLFLISTYFFMH